MKTNAIIGVGLVIALLGFVALHFIDNSYESEPSEPEVVIETMEVTPDWAQDEDAVKAAQDVIRKKELQAQEEQLVNEISGLQSELDEVRKELGTF